MAVQTPFFGKRDNSPSKADTSANTVTSPGTATLPSGGATGAAARPTGLFAGNSSTTAPVFAAVANADAATEEKGSKLTVGPNIKLKGVEITDCDTLFIEGVVEATIDARVIQISENGSFNGTANVDVAEIRGVYEGTLTVRDKLTVHASGKIKGKIVYGKLEVEEGANITGEISTGAAK